MVNGIKSGVSTSAAIPSPSTSDVMGQHNEIGGITFGAALVFRETFLRDQFDMDV